MAAPSIDEFTRRIEANEVAPLASARELELPREIVLETDAVYSRATGVELRAECCYRAETAGLRPAIVFVHGGGWSGGSRTQFLRQAAYLAAKHDFVGVTCQYRLSGAAKYPAAVRDAKCCIRWLRSRAEELEIDPGLVAVAGGSAGGHLAALVATTAGAEEFETDELDDYRSDVQACVPHNGAFDLPERARASAAAGAGGAKTAVTDFLGASFDEDPELWEAASPYHRATAEAPAFLLLHGDADGTIPHSQSVRMHERLLELSVHSEIEIFPGAAHGWFNGPPAFAEVLERMRRFLVERFAP